MQCDIRNFFIRKLLIYIIFIMVCKVIGKNFWKYVLFFNVRIEVTVKTVFRMHNSLAKFVLLIYIQSTVFHQSLHCKSEKYISQIFLMVYIISRTCWSEQVSFTFLPDCITNIYYFKFSTFKRKITSYDLHWL